MRRVIVAGLLALPPLLLVNSSAQAQYPVSGGCASGSCGGGFGRALSNPWSCQFCFRLFPGLHQEGPLFNYGPYAGYYPFEPYGPWNANLQYTGPVGTGWGGGCGAGGCGGGLGHGLGGLFHKHHNGDGCSSCGGYAKSTLHNVSWRVNPFGHKHHGSSCSTCGGGSAVVSESAEPAGVAHVAGGKAENPVQQAGYPRRER